GEDLLHVRQRLGLGAVGREPEVDYDRGGVGHDVARDTTADADRAEPFAVGTTVDLDGARRVSLQGGEDRSQPVDRVVSPPGSSAVRAPARGRNHYAQ